MFFLDFFLLIIKSELMNPRWTYSRGFAEYISADASHSYISAATGCQMSAKRHCTRFQHYATLLFKGSSSTSACAVLLERRRCVSMNVKSRMTQPMIRGRVVRICRQQWLQEQRQSERGWMRDAWTQERGTVKCWTLPPAGFFT